MKKQPIQSAGQRNCSRNNYTHSANTPGQPVCSGAPQEEIKGNSRFLTLQTGSRWMEVQKEKTLCFHKEAIAQMKNWAGKLTELAKEFAKHRINFISDIFPPFDQLYLEFAWVLASKKATVATVREYEKWWRRYQSPVRLLTEENAPFAQELKEQINKTYTQLLLPRDLKAMMLEGIRQNSWEKAGVQVLDRNIDKAPLKHPIWTRLQAHLFVTMLDKGVSEKQAFGLLARLFQTLLPQWFDVRNGEDTIRLNVKRLLKAPD